MFGTDPASRPARQANARWPDTPTRWTVVLAAREHDSPTAQAALEELCRTYWYPLYAFARRQGHKPHDAEDLVQGFFARLLEKRDLNSVDRRKGKFRSFLMIGFKNFAANEWDKSQRQKRTSGQPPLSLDFAEGEAAYARVVADPMTPEKQYERSWALEILGNALSKLQVEYVDAGKGAQFEVLKPLLGAKTVASTYAELAAPAGLKDGRNVKVAVYTLRQRYRELIREEVAQTLSNPTESEIEEEIKHLLAALGD